ncbi:MULTISPECIES: DNA primase [Synechococcus]|uniref:DNA primase n=1 Tax=Synechococcus TaxID=1129 RepID=UPI0020CBCEC3|nr:MULTISPECIES: DNA primase [Synechococcus]MCP9810584.1 DNA primase [Synechococcus lacustris Maggiore-St4-Slac]MCP9921405.1 DNA primase [Synechococcus lacustris Cruz CV12-2]
MSSPRLHPRTIEAVKERADIVEVVGEHVVLKKKGKEFVGICPFHDDKSPSMTVSPAKQFYYCFSCGAGGNSLKFLMELKRQSFSDVVLELARKYSLPVETLDAPQQERLKEQLTRRDKIHRALALASGWFRANLRSPIGAAALNYLQKDRGLNNGTIELFELGYAPNKWDALISHLQQVENIDINCLEMAGLVVARKGGDGFYDRFRERLMVPIHDRQGRIIGFGGRSLEGVEPKYLNSPETEVFEKGKHLFGLDKAADPIRRADCAIVVEGYFDVIALHAAGVRHSVAALGTALGSQQITQLCRCCDSRRIVLNFDADGAGIRAAQRAIGEVEQQALQGQIELRILPLPEGKDPDDFLKLQGSANYLALVEQAPLWLDWQIEQVLIGMDLNRADQFQQVVKALVELLGKLPQSALRSHYLQRVAERLSGGQSRMALQLEEDLRQQVKGQRWHGRSSRHGQPGEAGIRERAEAALLRLYLHAPAVRAEIRRELRTRDLEDFGIPHHRKLWLVISELEESKLGIVEIEDICRGSSPGEALMDIDIAKLLSDHLLETNTALLQRLSELLEPSELQDLNLINPTQHLRGTTASLERQRVIRRCRHLIEAWGSQRLQSLEHCISLLLEADRIQPANNDDGEQRIDLLFNELNADAIRFQELYYNERRYLTELDAQRCA